MYIMPVIYFSSGVIVMYVYCSIADGELYDLGMVMIWKHVCSIAVHVSRHVFYLGVLVVDWQAM
jgi:hypothetical protein